VSGGRGARIKALSFPSLGTLSANFVIPDGVTEIWVSFTTYEEDNYSVFSDVQIEKGSSATSFEPGTPHSYTVNLGSTELCKIGTYQDKIFNNDPNEDWYNPDLEDNAWYVHKETDSVTYDGSENWTVNTTFGRATTPKPNSNWVSWGTSPSTYASKGFSNYVKAGSTSDSGLDNIFNVGTTEIFVKATSAGTNINAATWKTWLNTHNLVCYAILATPTDTKITDATLVGQLNAIDSAVLPKPIAYITVTATDPNLPGPLKISYYGEEE
jgi:hypothetical protein